MLTFCKRIACITFGFLLAASAFATTASNQMIWDRLHASTVDTHTLSLNVNNDGIVTVAGEAAEAADRSLIVQLILHTDGVNDVINLVTTP